MLSGNRLNLRSGTCAARAPTGHRLLALKVCTRTRVDVRTAGTRLKQLIGRKTVGRTHPAARTTLLELARLFSKLRGPSQGVELGSEPVTSGDTMRLPDLHMRATRKVGWVVVTSWKQQH